MGASDATLTRRTVPDAPAPAPRPRWRESAWWVGAGWFSLPFVAGVGPRYEELATACRPVCTSRPLGTLSPAQIDALSEVGLTVQAFAMWDLAREGGLLVGSLVLGAILVRRVGSIVALLAAWVLVATAANLVPETPLAAVRADALPALLLEVPVVVALVFGLGVLLFIFPDGRWVPGWSRTAFAALAAASAIAVVVWAGDLDALDRYLTVVLAVVLPSGLWAQVHRYRAEADEVVRHQLRWLALGLGGWLLPLALHLAVLETGLLSPAAGDATYPLGYMALGLAQTAFLLILPISWSLAVLEHRLWEVDRILSRAALASFLVATAIAVFVALSVSLGVVAGTGTATALPIAIGSSLALFSFTRGWLRARIDRALFGDRGSPYTLITRLWQRGTAGPPTAGTLPELAEMLVSGLRLSAAHITVAGETGVLVDRRLGVPSPDAVAADFPLATPDAPIGRLRVWPRTGEWQLSTKDGAIVADSVAPIIHVASVVRLTEDLRRSRAAAVGAREEERRRIQRNVHDDFGPAVASQGMLMEAAADLLETDPEGAQRLLDLARAANEHLLVDVRRMAADLGPASLTHLGLEGSLRRLAAGVNASGVSGRLTMSGHDRLPAAVETAIHRIATEAVTNAVRHAGPGEVRVELEVGHGLAQLTVSDDGAGGVTRAHENAHDAVGLRSMRERAEELGGSLEIASPPGVGTTIHVRIPVTHG